MKKESFFEKHYTLIVSAIFAVAITVLIFLSLDAMLKDYEKSLNENQTEESAPVDEE